MSWPTPQDYNEAVQNPRIAFTDPVLREGQPELTSLGLPRPISGNFACVYKIQTKQGNWAARCFISEVSDLRQRYEAISEHLAKVQLPYTIPFSYLPAGIKLGNRPFPLVKMQWVQGEPLNAFVARALAFPASLLSLAKAWVQVMGELQASSIAHGDLQHGNVIVVGDQLRLIDYDGMFVPALNGRQSNELGHRNYQLPSRKPADYGPHLDNFSAWVIYVSFLVLAVHPEVWSAHRGGDECLIFRKRDFEGPDASPLLRELSRSPNDQLRFVIDLFKSFFRLSPRDVPSLDGNLPTVAVAAAKPWWGDFVENREQQATEATTRLVPGSGEPSADATWIVDFISDDVPVELARFQSKPKQLRVVAIGSLAVVLLAAFVLQLPALELALLSSFFAGFNLLLCVSRYVRDPVRAELRSFREESQRLRRHIDDQQRLVDTINAERVTLEQELAEADGSALTRKESLTRNKDAEIAKIQTELDDEMRAINRQRLDTSNAEKAKLAALNASLRGQIIAAEQNIAATTRQEAAEIEKIDGALRDGHVQQFLQRYSVADAIIPLIGDAYISRLLSAGFRTAADIDWSVTRVPGIGTTRQAALCEWKRQLTLRALTNAPRMPQHQRAAIQQRYEQQRQALQRDLNSLHRQLAGSTEAISKEAARVRQILDSEELAARRRHTDRKVLILRDYEMKIAATETEVQRARARVGSAISEVAEKAAATQKELLGLRWATAKRAGSGRRYARLRFRDYVRSVVWS